MRGSVTKSSFSLADLLVNISGEDFIPSSCRNQILISFVRVCKCFIFVLVLEISCWYVYRQINNGREAETRCVCHCEYRHTENSRLLPWDRCAEPMIHAAACFTEEESQRGKCSLVQFVIRDARESYATKSWNTGRLVLSDSLPACFSSASPGETGVWMILTNINVVSGEMFADFTDIHSRFFYI